MITSKENRLELSLDSNESFSSNSSNNERRSLEDIFRCFVCFGTLKDPHCCPYCSKMCCYRCLEKWLTEQRSCCPHCQEPLTMSQLVNCRFVNEVSEEIKKLKKDKEEECEKHKGVTLQYFCQVCQKALCPDCAIFTNEHQNHKILRLNDVYKEHVSKVEETANAVRFRKKELKNMLKKINSKVNSITAAKENKYLQFSAAIEKMQDQLNEQYQTKLLAIFTQKASIGEEIQETTDLLAEVENKMNSYTKTSFIQKTDDLLARLDSINLKPTDHLIKDNVSAEFHSEIVPDFIVGRMILHPFSQLKKSADMLYSSEIKAYGASWRLKVYPNGNGVAFGSHLSVFLELVEGIVDHAKYEYYVVLISRRNSDRKVMREFASEFEAHDCWGYNKFCQLDKIEHEGFISQDTLELRFGVRPPSFSQLAHHQNTYIDKLEKERREHISRIRELQGTIDKFEKGGKNLNVEETENEKDKKRKNESQSTTKNDINFKGIGLVDLNKNSLYSNDNCPSDSNKAQKSNTDNENNYHCDGKRNSSVSPSLEEKPENQISNLFKGYENSINSLENNDSYDSDDIGEGNDEIGNITLRTNNEEIKDEGDNSDSDDEEDVDNDHEDDDINVDEDDEEENEDEDNTDEEIEDENMLDLSDLGINIAESYGKGMGKITFEDDESSSDSNTSNS
eukprot:gb/GECH01009384.1/.p1 GENE.gb/GECH01009384.1/~~gb/GECH01009384.1/.p1  ORF type:complete len:678 (+),score=182.24 gb/GECH01009384.1/:1-2034(+)